MSIFDKLKNKASQATSAPSSFDKSQKEAVITFTALPESLAEMKSLPEAALDSPFSTAALALCALCVYAADKNIGAEMLNFLRGPRGELSAYDKQFLNERFSDEKYYIPFSYFNGAVLENDYTPSQPYTVRIFTDPYTYQNEGYAKVNLTSGGADSPRQIVLRLGGDGKWYLWDQFVLVGIREPKSKNPWA